MAPPIDLHDLSTALAAWSLGDHGLEPLVSGAQGQVWRITCARGAFVAKVTFDTEARTASALLASLAVDGLDSRVVPATPLPADDGRLTVPVGGTGGDHPLALLRWVDGEPLDRTDEGAAEIAGRTLALVHEALTNAGPAALGIPSERGSHLNYMRIPPSPNYRRADVLTALGNTLAEVEALEASKDLTYAIGVWDGPQMLVADGVVGLIDWHDVEVQPVAFALADHAGANGSDWSFQERALAAYRNERPLTDDDVEAIPVYERLCLAVHLKYRSTRSLAEMDAQGHREAIDDLLSQLL